MINPMNLTNYERNDFELQELILFSILVAGKNAITISKRLDLLLSNLKENDILPLEYLKKIDLLQKLKDFGFGCYNIKSRSIKDLISKKINLRTCCLEELEAIFGIGPKTARMFLLHSRKNQEYAVLDVHVLKYMKHQGLDVPASTPGSKKLYKKIEDIFIELAKNSGMTIADFDLKIWKKYSGRENMKLVS